MSMCSLTIIGNLGREAETSVLPSGVTKVTMNVAVGRPRRDGQEETTDWYRVQAFGKYAEGLDRLAQMGGLQKGRQVAVRGRLEPRLYEASDGTTKLSLDVYAEDLEALGPKPVENGHAAAPQQQRPAPPRQIRPQLSDFGPADRDLDEIPFVALLAGAAAFASLVMRVLA